jgi:hypothetical protein
VMLGDRNSGLDLRDKPGHLAGVQVDPEEVFGNNGLRIAVAELRPQPSPCAQPAIAAFLFLRPVDAFAFALGKAQRNRALRSVAIGRNYVKRRIMRRFRGGASRDNVLTLPCRILAAVGLASRCPCSRHC